MKILLAITAFVLMACMVAAEENQHGTVPWIATARIVRNGDQSSGSGVYLGRGFIITAAHVVDPNAQMSVDLAGAKLPARVLKQGIYEETDLSLLAVDPSILPGTLTVSDMSLCSGAPWPGDPVIVVDASNASRSHIVSPKILNFTLRNKFATLIGDVATTGNSGSGVFDPERHCLLGIMSRKFTSSAGARTIDIAKYFVPADDIRTFVAEALKASSSQP